MYSKHDKLNNIDTGRGHVDRKTDDCWFTERRNNYFTGCCLQARIFRIHYEHRRGAEEPVRIVESGDTVFHFIRNSSYAQSRVSDATAESAIKLKFFTAVNGDKLVMDAIGAASGLETGATGSGVCSGVGGVTGGII